MSELIVNGRHYPLWSQFVEKKDEWIGGQMFDHDTVMGDSEPTEITDVRLDPNGETSAMLRFLGKDYECSCDVQYLGVGGPTLPGWLTLRMTFGGGGCFNIKKKSEVA